MFFSLPVPVDADVISGGELHAMQHLRMSIFHAIRSAVLDVKKLIIILIKEFPLKSHVDSLSYHLAFLDEIDLQCAYTQETSIAVQQLQVSTSISLFSVLEPMSKRGYFSSFAENEVRVASPPV